MVFSSPAKNLIIMQQLPEPEMTIELRQSIAADSSSMNCFSETPGKTGGDETLPRIDAFDLFTLFTADIIRKNEVFTR
jgi:hypothetical protein